MRPPYPQPLPSSSSAASDSELSSDALSSAGRAVAQRCAMGHRAPTAATQRVPAPLPRPPVPTRLGTAAGPAGPAQKSAPGSSQPHSPAQALPWERGASHTAVQTPGTKHRGAHSGVVRRWGAPLRVQPQEEEGRGTSVGMLHLPLRKFWGSFTGMKVWGALSHGGGRIGVHSLGVGDRGAPMQRSILGGTHHAWYSSACAPGTHGDAHPFPPRRKPPVLTLSPPSATSRHGPALGQQGVLQRLQLLLLLQCRRLPPAAQLFADVLLPAQAMCSSGNLHLQRQVPLQGSQRVLGVGKGTLGTLKPPPPHPEDTAHHRALRIVASSCALCSAPLWGWDGEGCPITAHPFVGAPWLQPSAPSPPPQDPRSPPHAAPGSHPA